MKLNVSKFLKNAQKGLKEHSPEILTGLGISGLVATVFMTSSGTVKALAILDDATQENCNGHLVRCDITYLPKALPLKERIRLTWPCYIPSIITGCLSISCLIGASSVSAKRNAALATAYTITEGLFKEYRGKMIEKLGEEGEQKDKEVRETIAKEHVKKKNRIETVIVGDGTFKFYDDLYGGFVDTTKNDFMKGLNEANSILISQGYISLNEFYDCINMDSIGSGNRVGWRLDRDGLIDIGLYSEIKNDVPSFIINYYNEPDHNFDSGY